MIFVTVGTQLPFDRLIREMDEIAPLVGMPIFAQTGVSHYRPRRIEAQATLSPTLFREKMMDCEVVVSHAGIGTILSAINLEKPILVMPRRAAFGEHRNDHQLATCRHLRGRRGVCVVESGDDILDLLKGHLERPDRSIFEASRSVFLERLSDVVGEVTTARQRGGRSV